MKKAHFIAIVVATFIIGSVVFTACQKSGSSVDNNTPTEQDALALQASATADDASDNAFNDALDNVLGVNDDIGLGGGIGVFFAAPHQSSGNNGSGTPVSQFGEGVDTIPHCWSLTIDPGTPGAFPKTVTIDFGTGCEGRDGHTRRGKIIAVYTGRMKEPGSSVTASFDGFYIDSIKVEGSLAIKNNSTSNNRVFRVTVTNGKISVPSGGFVEINRDHTWTQTEGNGTPNLPADDVFSITGSSNGTAQLFGVTAQWTTEIIDPVIRKLSCHWRVSGQVKVTYNSKTGVLDYGSGECDDKATITVGAKVYNIKLH